MPHTHNPIIKHKAGLLDLADEPGNVSKSCRIMGVSRDTFGRGRTGVTLRPPHRSGACQGSCRLR